MEPTNTTTESEKIEIVKRHEMRMEQIRACLKGGDVIQAAQLAGSHFFDRDTVRAFGSRLAPDMYCLKDGSVLFITSEKDRYGTAWNGARLYTVRLAFLAPARLEGFTITEPTPPGVDPAVGPKQGFGFFKSLADARWFARKLKAADVGARDLVAPYYFGSTAPGSMSTPACPLKEA